MGVVKVAIGDAVLTFIWMLTAAPLGIFTFLIQNALGLHSTASGLIITTCLIAIQVFVFTLLGDAMGGASFNPTGTASFYAAGIGDDNLISMALRFPAQAIGAVGGALAIIEVMPSEYKHMLGGPSLKVDVHTGAIVEGILTFVISFAVLYILFKGPNSPLLKISMLSMSTVALIVAGSSFTGPSMNPANAFGWAFVNNRHNTWEQFYVYWICPFVGAILASWIFRILFPSPAKQKKA